MKPQKQTVKGPITTTLEEGQSYIDVPVYGQVPVYCGKEPMTGVAVRYYKRTPLRWMEPDGKGGLRPKFTK